MAETVKDANHVTKVNNVSKPTIHTHNDSGLRYLRGKDTVLFENGVTIPRSMFDENKNLREVLKNGSSEYDWRYACETGTLRRKKKSAKKPVQKEEVVKQEEAPIKQPQQPSSFSAFPVMAVMTLVGIGSAIMSAYHTSMFLYQGGKPAWTAIMTGTMLILFSGTAFTAARYFKGIQNVISGLFIIAGFAVIAYSIFSTVTVNYNQFKWVDDTKITTAVEGNEQLAAHERLLTDTRDALVEVGERIIRLESEADYWKTQSWRRYDEFQSQLVSAQQERSALRQRLIELETVKPELITLAGKSQETIYSFLARLLGLPEDIARFFVYVVPACLYDILAPFALSVVLLLADRRKKLNT
jgi:cation transport ATPase